MRDSGAKDSGMQMQNPPSATGMSGPVPTIDLGSEIAGAELILVGTVTTVNDASRPVSLVSPQAEPAKDQLRVAELAVVRTLAGEHGDGLIRVFFLVGKTPSRPWMDLTQGQTVLLFLHAIDGGYVPVMPSGIPIQTLLGIASPPAGASKTQAVAYELEQVILTADSVSAVSLLVQATTARAGLQGDVDLHLFSTTVLQNPVRRAAWVAIALAEGKVKVLAEVQGLAVNPPPPPADALWHLVVQKVSELRVPAARPQLAALLESPKVELARAAAVALRQLHDRAAMPDLIRALDHPDQEVRYQAVMGLAELEPSVEAGPAFELYRTDESQYIQRWKQWWQSSGIGSH